MATNPFSDSQQDAAGHFKLVFYAAVLNLIHNLSQVFGSTEAALTQFPFLIGYNNELAAGGLAGVRSDEAIHRWLDSLRSWEADISAHLPLRALREAAGLDSTALILLMSVGLVEEDVRFGQVFEMLQDTPGQRHLSVGLLSAWARADYCATDARVSVRRLRELGWIRVVNPEAARLEWALEVPEFLWDALRGEQPEQPAPWLSYRSPAEAKKLDELILPAGFHQQLREIPALLAADETQSVIVRGAQGNGRRTILGAVANALGWGSLQVHGLEKVDDRWRLLGPLATALHAMPVISFELGPEETAHLPPLQSYHGPLGIALGKQGGITGADTTRALTLTLELPAPDLRRRHWQSACGANEIADLGKISERFRLTVANIQRAAELAHSYATLSGRAQITLGDVQQATRALNRQTLDTLAVRVKADGDWTQLAVGTETRSELESLESRCRHREHLHKTVGATLATQLNPGVRALFSGTSGTGKSLAARALAAALQMDLFRLDLSAVVNKYIGETEKNLNQIFSRAEELDVILLLDEGDALLTRRTSVNTSNDRYANLETNYLLQRIESFEGILIVTTNAGERIDSAFQRRMDVVIDFPAPDPHERWAIWHLHLPAEHAVDYELLEEIAGRCRLSGGEIRNAALHASLLAIRNGGVITSEYLEVAIQREYRKIGAVCPLRQRVLV